MSGYTDANRANWDERAPLHADRGEHGYRISRYIADRSAISDVVRFDLPRLGPIEGLRAVHLQCHIGTDTLSLARLGARVTGLDFSPNAIDEARRLVADTGDDVDFVVADVYEAPDVLAPASFDLVYTGVGALCWLPDVDRWAQVVTSLLAPGGTLHLREGHPILWSMDERLDDDLHLRFPYWEREQPLEWDDDSTYVETTRPLTATRTYEWNHSLGEIVTALIRAGLRIDLLEEHDSVPWEALPGQMVERDGEFVLAALDGVAPLSYTLRAGKPV
ncbi:methyltransferase [Leifsonia xyli]|uniref:class I SAM-dependent methyltransferase n=1 Tax=Leifsonia xyli TaxID=1575 RepID=UPI0007CDAF28|nr:methyltransferase [Leifsonia xyli]